MFRAEEKVENTILNWMLIVWHHELKYFDFSQVVCSHVKNSRKREISAFLHIIELGI